MISLWILGIAASMSLVYVIIIRPIYNIFFHPLRNYPGPKMWAATQIPYQLMGLSGHGHRRMLEMHRKYGEVIRVGPDELAFHRPDAWKQIMGHRKAGDVENTKDPKFYGSMEETIVGAPSAAAHGRYRRMLAHGFSAQNIVEQQPLILHYVDLLMKRLREQATQSSQPIEMTRWFNFATFDIIGDLTFGGSFGCLQDSHYHPWIAKIFKSISQAGVMHALNAHIPNFDKIIMRVVPSAAKEWNEHQKFIQDNVNKRMQHPNSRPDFMQSLLQQKAQDCLNLKEIYSTAFVLVMGGSETTSNALSGVVYYLSTNPSAMSKLTAEIYEAFSNEDEIDVLSTQGLKYMDAVIQESMRLFPPVPIALPRVTPPTGQVLFGKFIPPRTTLSVWQWPMYRDPAFFKAADEFHPERWLGDENFATDCKEAFQPFSHGSRNCIGKNLAFAEMRLILARLVWNFDLQLDDSSIDWERKNEVHHVWKKADLNVRLMPRRPRKNH